jgi:hypothetical protein
VRDFWRPESVTKSEKKNARSEKIGNDDCTYSQEKENAFL